MKKTFTLLIILATAYCSFAQDTITGVVNRIAAPYFEQNVCDTRFAITTDSETYYVMVDNYWPNPYLEDLVIHYDTIAIGNEISVIGDIKEMEDGNGEVFNVIDVQKLVGATYSYGTGFISWFSQYAIINCNVAPDYACYLAINGVLQTNFPIIFNGMTLNSGAYTMVGIAEYWPDYDLPILELTQVIPYAIEATANGVIVANDELCLFTPCGDTKYLSFSENNETYYLTNKDKLHNEDFFSPMWGDNVNSNIQGFGNTHYDLFGAPFNTFETLSMETTGERNIVGPIITVGNPSISSAPPIGMRCAIIDNNDEYLVENPQQWDYSQTQCIIENDTLPFNIEVIGFFTTTHMFLGNGITPYMEIAFDSINANTFGTSTVSGTLTIQTYHNYQQEPFFVIVNNEDDYFIGTGPFTDATSGLLIVGQDTIHVGDNISATGEIGRFYSITATYPTYIFDIHNTINIDKVSIITELSEVYDADIQIYPNPSNGIVEIASKQLIEHISVYDYTGHNLLFYKSCNSEQINLDLQDYKGLAIIQIIFENGQALSRKIVVH